MFDMFSSAFRCCSNFSYFNSNMQTDQFEIVKITNEIETFCVKISKSSSHHRNRGWIQFPSALLICISDTMFILRSKHNVCFTIFNSLSFQIATHHRYFIDEYVNNYICRFRKFITICLWNVERFENRSCMVIPEYKRKSSPIDEV